MPTTPPTCARYDALVPPDTDDRLCPNFRRYVEARGMAVRGLASPLRKPAAAGTIEKAAALREAEPQPAAAD
jgi:hypothetical protein